ncbi:MAG: class IV adenylate cyclase [Candidatus Hodarchaeota archaeon]
MAQKKVNFEFKARCKDPSGIVLYLENAGAIFKGLDRQIDTYFNVKYGRLKLREGQIENYLIWYNRSNSKGSKKSEILLFRPGNGHSLKDILIASLGVFAVVDKKRQIYFLENVKFHIDDVKGLGDFIEVEAQGSPGEEEQLQEQCEYYRKQLGVQKEEIIGCSYSDLTRIE